MNYLAHANLSFGQSPILVGNMISDFVKGKKQYEYERAVQNGIKLHRAIDNFTDTHPVIKEMKKPFREKYGLYAGAFTDIVCDYFLANDKNEFFSAGALASFSQDCYHKLEGEVTTLPEKFQQYFVYMKQQDWLFNYQFEWMIQRSFMGIVKRAKYMDDSETAFWIFQNNIETMRLHYIEFYPLLKKHALQTLQELERFN
ncbi:MAG: ACP phosphodiesterase [Ferruginibacter sp.]